MEPLQRLLPGIVYIIEQQDNSILFHRILGNLKWFLFFYYKLYANFTSTMNLVV